MRANGSTPSPYRAIARSLSGATIIGAAILVAFSLGSSALVLLLGTGVVLLLTRAIRSSQHSGGQAALPVVPEVLLLPLCLNLQPVVGLRGAVALLSLLAIAAALRGGALFGKLPHIALGPLTLLIAAALVVFSHQPKVLALVSIALVVTIATSQRSQVAAMSSLIDGFGLYCAVNVVAYYVLQIHGDSGPRTVDLDSSLSSVSGISAKRVYFPFAQSLNVPSLIAAAALIGLALLLVQSPQMRRLRLTYAASAIIVLVAVNVRTALVIAVVLGLLALIRQTWLRRSAPLLIVAAFLMPIFYQSIAPIITPVAETIAATPGLTRTHETSAFSNRAQIWGLAMQAFGEVPTSRKLIGFGPEGQVASGASSLYGQIFEGNGFGDRVTLSPHSSSIQQLLDGGVVGLAFLLGGILLCVRRYNALGTAAGIQGVALITSLCVSGITESVLAPGTRVPPFLLLLFIVALTPASRPTAGATRTDEAVHAGFNVVERAELTLQPLGKFNRRGA